jgi:hypothetical protein
MPMERNTGSAAKSLFNVGMTALEADWLGNKADRSSVFSMRAACSTFGGGDAFPNQRYVYSVAAYHDWLDTGMRRYGF